MKNKTKILKMIRETPKRIAKQRRERNMQLRIAHEYCMPSRYMELKNSDEEK